MRKTVLVVEDFASIRNFVCSTLQRKGYATLGAANGGEALKILAEKGNEVNLVLTDYNMPDITGYDLLVKVKSAPATAHVPVIFLTTELSGQKMENAKAAGLFAWIKKPYRAEDFFELIENALNSNVKNITI